MLNDADRRNILVTDGEQRATLAVVRSLGAQGHYIHVCSSRTKSLAGASRFAHSEQLVASALTDPDRFVDDVYSIVRRHGIDTVIPMTEPALLALLPSRDRFANVMFPFADAATFAAISDKQTLLEAARRIGIAVPAQTVIENADAAASLDTDAIKYPVVVKPARSVSTGTGARLKVSVRHAQSATELHAILGEMDDRAYPLLLQQRILGPGIGIFALIWDGELIAQFAHRRIREQPPSGGISVYRESVAIDPELLGASLALLREFAWQSVAMIEYKLDAHTGKAYLMEINGRFWGSLQLAIDSGVDFPRLLIEAATGLSPTPVTQYRTNVRSRWFWGDVDHLLARVRKSDAHLALPPGAPSRWTAAREFFARHPDDVSEILRRDDFRPFLRESIQWFQHFGR